MKNTFLIILGVLVLTIGGIGGYLLMNSNAPMTKPDSIERTKEMGMASEAPTMKNESKYTSFTPEVLVSTVTTRRVLFFYANWCPTCKSADASFTKNMAEIPTDITVIRVNYNDTETDQVEKDLAKKYGVTYQHTFVQIDAEGNEVTKWNGGQINELSSNAK